jgi:hypothetical protein
MKWNRVAANFAAGLVLVAAAAQAEEKRYHDKISGAAAPSSFDINGDGGKAHYVTFTGQSSLGPVYGTVLVEYDFPAAAPNPACPTGTVKLPILVSAGNRAVSGAEGALFLRDDAASALFCLNLVTGAFTMRIKGIFTGGLGKYAGATGTYEYRGGGQVQLLDKAGVPYGGFLVETEGRLALPDRPRDRD